MKQIVLVAALLFPVAGVAAGWDYYVLNEDGNWETISPRELDLSTAGRYAADAGDAGEKRRVMILYNQPEPDPERRKTLNWIRQVGSDLVEQVE